MSRGWYDELTYMDQPREPWLKRHGLRLTERGEFILTVLQGFAVVGCFLVLACLLYAWAGETP